MGHGLTFTSFITPTQEPAKEEQFVWMGGKKNHLGCLLPNGKVLCLPNETTGTSRNCSYLTGGGELGNDRVYTASSLALQAGRAPPGKTIPTPPSWASSQSPATMLISLYLFCTFLWTFCFKDIKEEKKAPTTRHDLTSQLSGLNPWIIHAMNLKNGLNLTNPLTLH